MITNAKNPRWADVEHTRIFLDVLHKNEEEYVSFCASPTDCTEYGPMLYNFAKDGLFGEVQDSDEERILAGEIPPPEGCIVQNGEIINLVQIEQEAQAKLDQLLGELQTPQALAQAELDETYAAERKLKLAALLAVKDQQGWPQDVIWP